jgi:hypothetical protein
VGYILHPDLEAIRKLGASIFGPHDGIKRSAAGL